MNLLVTGAWGEAKKYISRLSSMGHNVSFLQNEEAAIPCDYSLIEGIIGNAVFLSHNIELFTNLRYVQLTSAGYDRVPIDYIRANGIKLYNAQGVYDIPIAEMALTGVLCLYKKIGVFFANKTKHIWEKQRFLPEVSGKNVLIIGCGSIGTECASKFSALGANVSGVDIKTIKNPLYNHVYTLEDTEKALESADVAILTLPISDKTKWFMNADKFIHMKRGSILVNVSRGGVVKTEDLVGALKNGLGGAVLDVFETEPLEENSPLWDMENVFITPHNSFSGEGNSKRLSDLILSNLSNENL